MEGQKIHTTIHQKIVFDSKRAELGAKGLDSCKAVAEVEAEGGLQRQWRHGGWEAGNGGNKWPIMQHQDNEGNWRAEKLFRNFIFP